MSDALVGAIDVGAHLVARRHLRGQTHQEAADGGIVDALAAVIEKSIRDRVIRSPEALRGEKPQLVLQDWPAQGAVEIPHLGDAVDRRHATVAQVLREVVALPIAVRPTEEHAAVERVAAVLGHHVQQQAAGLRFGGAAAGLKGNLLIGDVLEIGVLEAVADQRVHEHAVDLIDGV
jgi:hypothetical protein